MSSNYKTREQWLHAAARLMRKRYVAAGVDVPTDFHVSVGFKPGGGPESAKVMGCCYVRLASTANVNEIFISPEWDNPADVLETLAHELIHAASDCQDGHGPGFKRDALAFGFLSPMTSTPASDELKLFLRMVAATLGPYPHSATRIMALKRRPKTDPVKPDGNASTGDDGGPKVHSGRPKQGTSYLKLECVNPTCGFIARATAKSLDLGMPICACGTPLSCPQYAEILLDRLSDAEHPYSWFAQEPARLEKRREWSRARGFLPAIVSAVSSAAKAVAKKTAKRAAALPAAAVEAIVGMRGVVEEGIDPYPSTLGDQEQYPHEALAAWETAETLADLFWDLSDALGDMLPA